jgi:hypothetical protein
VKRELLFALLLAGCAGLAELLACGTQLSSTDQSAEENTATNAAALYAEHAEGGLDKIRAHAMYCNSAAILARAHADAAAPPGAPVCQ